MASNAREHRTSIRSVLVGRCAAAAAVVLGIFVSAQVNAADTLLVSGPVESIDFAQQSVVILGQPIRLSSRTSYFVGSIENAASASRVDQRAVRLLEGGRVAAVWGNDGTNATAVLISRERSVPGSTQVFSRSSNRSRSVTRICNRRTHTDQPNRRTVSWIPLTSPTGDTLRVMGTQPVPAGTVIVGSDFVLFDRAASVVAQPSGIGGSSDERHRRQLDQRHRRQLDQRYRWQL